MLKLSIVNILIFTTVASNRNNSSYFKQKQLQQKTLVGLVEMYYIVDQSTSPVQLLVTPWTAAHQASLSFTISRNLCKLMSTESMMPSNHLIPCLTLPFLPSIFPSRVFSSSTGASASASVLPMSIQGWFPQDWLIWSPCCPRDSQESSPVLSLLYGPTLTSVHDYWKNLSFDYMDLCW